MKRILAVLFALAATLPVTAETITNDDVIRMAKAGLSAETIELKIRHSKPSFDTSTDALIALKEAGVTEPTIRLMMETQTAAAPAPEAKPVVPVAPAPAPPPTVPARTEIAAVPATGRSLYEITIRNAVSGTQCSSGFLKIGPEGLAATGCLGSNFRLEWAQIESACRGPETSMRLTTSAGTREFSAPSTAVRDEIERAFAAFSPDLAIDSCSN